MAAWEGTGGGGAVPLVGGALNRRREVGPACNLFYLVMRFLRPFPGVKISFTLTGGPATHEELSSRMTRVNSTFLLPQF